MTHKKNSEQKCYSVTKGGITIPSIFSQINADIKISLEIINGFISASRKNLSTGEILSYSGTFDNNFRSFESINPSEMSVTERQNIVKALYRNGRGESQTTIAKKLGVSQSTISKDVRQIKANNSTNSRYSRGE